MEIDSPLAAGPSSFRSTPALGVTYVLDTEEDIKQIIPIPPVDDPNDEDYDPRADRDIDDDDSEDNLPYPTPSSIVHGKRKATEIYDDDEEWPRQSYGQHRKKKRLAERSREEQEYIYISSDSEDDIVQIPKAAEKKSIRQIAPPKQLIAPLKPKRERDTGPPDEASASSEAEMGSVERWRPDAPTWLDMQLAKTRKEYPSAKLELCYHYSIDGDVWRVKCTICPRTCSVGPGQSLVYMGRHLRGAQHQARMGNGPRVAGSSNDAGKTKAAPRREPSPQLPAPDRVAARPATSNGREKAAQQDGAGDDVERFLDQIGVPVDLAPKLRSVGFVDDARMNKMGRLADESLGLIMEQLTKQGVDAVTAIMVREGLKRRAGTL